MIVDSAERPRSAVGVSNASPDPLKRVVRRPLLMFPAIRSEWGQLPYGRQLGAASAVVPFEHGVVLENATISVFL